MILAGGRSRRMGRDKADLQVGGQSLLVRTACVLSEVVDEILVVGRDSFSSALPHSVRAVPDEVPGIGPLGGLLSGLRRTTYPYAVVVACDLPFLDAGVLRHLLTLAPGYDAVVPFVGGHNQPLHAVYRADGVGQRKVG